jgi:hypothetical protein
MFHGRCYTTLALVRSPTRRFKGQHLISPSSTLYPAAYTCFEPFKTLVQC